MKPTATRQPMRKFLLPLLANLALLQACPPTGPAGGAAGDKRPAAAAANPYSIPAMTEAMFAIETALDDADKLADMHRRYERQVQLDPQHPFKRFLWAYTLPDRNQAWAELTKITKLNDKFFWAFLGMGVILDGWGVFDQAEKNFQQALKLGPNIAVGRALYGRMKLNQKRPREALALLQRACELEPQRYQYRLWLARAQVAAGQAEQALTSYRRVLDIKADEFSALRELGLLLARQNQPGKAAEILERAAAVRPGDCQVKLARARNLDRAGQGQAALVAFEEACNCLGSDKACRKEQAALAVRLKDEAGERRAWEQVLDIDGKDLEACRFLAPRFLAEGAIEKALPAYQTLLDKEPGNVEAMLGLASIFEKGGEYSQALEMSERVLAAEPGNEQARAIRQRLFTRFHISDPPPAGTSPQRVFNQVRALIAKVYKLRLEEKPSLQGELLVKVTVDNEGKVAQVSLARDTLNDTVLDICAVWNLRRARFPKGFGATYDFALTLKPGD